MNGASLVLQTLQQQGVSKIFGYPGGAIMPIYDALYDSELKHFLCRHEQGAAFAALGYSRAAKTVGVCMATSGPGATNLITGLADAMADSVAMVAITGQVASSAMGSDAFQEVDIIGLSLGCTKHCFQLNRVEDIPLVIAQAFAIAKQGRPGPVLIDIPKDIQLAVVNKPIAIPPPQSIIEEQQLGDLSHTLALIQQAERPVAYVGGGVCQGDAAAELQKFLSLSQIPCVATLKGLGAIAKDNDNYLGMLGMHGTKAANLAVQQCDLLIAIGARFDDRVTGKLNDFASNAKVVHLDIDRAEINKRRQADSAIIADLKTSLPALTTRLSIEPWRNHCLTMNDDFGWRYDHPGESIYAPKLLHELSNLMPQSTIVTTDVGQHQMWTAQHMRFNGPNKFLTSGGLGTMGFGLPAAIGAQVACPQDCVIAISGDGSFMMNVQELSTIKRYQLPVKILLIDNSRLGMVRQWQEIFFNQRYSETDLSDNPDFVALAKAFDIEAKQITKKTEVSNALTEMLNSTGPFLLQVSINELDNVWPLVPPETANDKMMEKSPCKPQ
jgi:acetolactate synthase-1/2/3 large subunit